MYFQLNQNTEQEVQKIKNLEDSNQALQKEVERLLAAAVTTEKLVSLLLLYNENLTPKLVPSEKGGEIIDSKFFCYTHLT